ncbi:hypothetical protein ACSBOB_10275 [Mesorhizobium sp. ASY16-5R]|uniref:hypothetical protein n=1 Tax=Mesorhizobium sp. ASY16-5R TaxID=3445772 RepID=UPI003FA05D8C
MDGSAAIERNREALKRILVSLLAMAGLSTGGQFTFFRQKSPSAPDVARAEKSKLSPALTPALSPALTLPRRLHRAILKLLHPAEAAARRLIIAAARGMVITLPPPRPGQPKAKTMDPLLRRFGIAVTVSRADLAATAAAAKRAAARPRSVSLSLFDPLKRPFRGFRPLVPDRVAPRILFPGVSEPSCFPAPPSPDDPVDALRLGQRLAALSEALNDLPGQARRFARWKARNDAALARDREARDAGVAQNRRGIDAGRFRRISPLRPGRPPGGRLSRYEPSADHPRKIRDIDEILAHSHALAVYALDTS